jgi:hypothetical protein
MGMKRVSGDPSRATENFRNNQLRKETRAVRAASLVLVGVIKETLSTPGQGAIRRGGAIVSGPDPLTAARTASCTWFGVALRAPTSTSATVRPSAR